MTNIKNIKIALWGLAIALIVILTSMGFAHPKTALGDSMNPNYIQKMNVSTGVSVSTSSVTALAASSGRVYAIFVNDGAVPIYLGLDGNAAVANKGIRLNATGGSYEINGMNLDIGLVTAITASGTAVLTVTAKQ